MKTLHDLFHAAVDAADAGLRLPQYLPPPPSGKMIVIALGKGAIRMAEVFEAHYQGQYTGLVVGSAAQAPQLRNLAYRQGSHPIPSKDSVAAGQALLEVVRSAQPEDHVLCLLSGGASALAATPPVGVALNELQSITQGMLNSGANIAQLNAVRRCVSQIAGGRLAAASSAPVTTLAISDVTGDVPQDIGSGPTSQSSTGPADVQALMQQFGLEPSAELAEFLASPAAQAPSVSGAFHLIATPQQSLQAAADLAAERGLNVLNLGGFIEGNADDVARVMAGIARQIQTYEQPVGRPAVILSGGETAVHVRGKGSGGRNVQFLMALAQALSGQEGIEALACDTDGVDGAAEIAGGWIGPDSIARANAGGYPLKQALDTNDGHGWFEHLGDQVITGPTQTNVNDFRAVLVY